MLGTLIFVYVGLPSNLAKPTWMQPVHTIYYRCFATVGAERVRRKRKPHARYKGSTFSQDHS